MDHQIDQEVLIVGLGPVGCTAALFLAEAGIKVTAVERDKEVYRLPRAVNLDGEIIRAFQRIGRAETVDHLMQTIRPGDRAGFANSKREWLFGMEAVSRGSNGWQPMNMFDQPEFEGYLRKEALSHPNVTSHIGWEVTKITNQSGHVKIDIQTTSSDEHHQISAPYVIACDGASSFTRKSFDIEWTDLGYDCDWLVVDIITNNKHTLDNSTLQVCDPDRIHTYVCTKDPYRRWEFKMNPGESREQMLEEETIRSLIDAWTPRDSYEIRRAAVYQFHAATAQTWRVGNTFIAGDAAHQTPPFLGQGMNTGMRDVINLCWKLPMVLRGDANDELLNSYEAERNAHAHDLVDWAVAIGRLMDHTAEVEGAMRDGKPPPPAPEQLQSAGYGQGREQPPIRDGAVLLDQVSDTGSTGYLFSQPSIEIDGERNLLDELLGDGFAVVTKLPELELSESAEKILEAIDAKIVSVHDLTITTGHLDRLFNEHDTAVVRPDRIVFGHTTATVGLDDLIHKLAQKLALTNY